MLAERVADLEKAVVDEKLYYNTMPYSIYKSKLAHDKLSNEKLVKFEQNIVNSLISEQRGLSLSRRVLLSRKKQSDPTNDESNNELGKNLKYVQ